MKVTLRKAKALQQNILDTIKSNQIVTTVTIDEFENASSKIAEVYGEFIRELSRQKGLYKALYEIRNLVGKANEIEINAKLTEVSYIEKMIQLHSSLSGAGTQTSIGVIEGKLEKIKSAPLESRSLYSRNENVSTSVLSKEVIEDLKSSVNSYKKSKQKLQDEILELNISTTIELSEEVVGILKFSDIL